MNNIGRTLVCSVLFLDIVEYSKRTNADQTTIKQSFNRTLSSALDGIAERDRVVLDTGDGAAVAFLGDPEDALFVALEIRETIELDVRMGVHLGPVRLVTDLNGQKNIIGDGINVAQRVMSFAAPGQFLVSRAFFEVASRLSNDYAELFTHQGSRSDKHVREHEVYSVGMEARSFKKSTGSDLDPKESAEEPQAARDQVDIQDGGSSVAQVFDAGSHLIISGYSKASVEEALNKLADIGARIISAASRVNDKWMASCEHPQAASSKCKVVTISDKQIVTGPTREAVASKVRELSHYGSRLLGDISLRNGVWMAVCQPPLR